MQRSYLITPAATYPVTLCEAKAHLSIVDDTSHDDRITALIAAATMHVEELTGRAFVSQTWEVHQARFSTYIYLPKAPAISVTSIKYYNENDELATLDSSEYRLINPYHGKSWVEPVDDWPDSTLDYRSDLVQVRYVAGYSSVPTPIKQAILLLVAAWNTNREGELVGTISKQLELGVDRLIGPYIVRRFV